MPELDAGAGRAAKGPAVEDHSSAAAGAEREHDDVGGAARGPRPPLADACRIRVVVETDGQGVHVAHAVAQVDVGERRVHGGEDAARALVDGRRDAEADGDDRIVAQLRDDGVELGEQLVLGGRGRALVAAHDLALARDDAGEDLRPAEVDADRMRDGHDERVP